MHGRYASHPIAPAMVFVSLRENTLTALIKAAHEVLGAGRGGPEAGRRERNYCGRKRILFTTRERILSGDWRMLRVPTLPANPMANSLEDDYRDPIRPHEIELNLVALAAEAAPSATHVDGIAREPLSDVAERQPVPLSGGL
jgi:hypothetical protein